MLHSEVSFAGCERFGKMLRDQGRGEAWPGFEMATLDGAKESGREQAESTSMKESCESMFCAKVTDGAIGCVAMLRADRTAGSG